MASKSVTTQDMVKALKDLENIQATNGVVEQVVLHGRVTTASNNNVSPITGLVQKPTWLFFSGKVGQPGNGFARPLTTSDLNDWIGGDEMFNNVAFLGLRLWMWFSDTMPIITMRKLIQSGFASVKRLNLEMEIGRPLDWPSGSRGVQAAAAATGFAADRIIFPVNGLSDPRVLSEFGRWLLPANNQFKASLTLQVGDIYATTDGLPLNINNALIPNDGSDGEDRGYFELCIDGLKWAAQG
jgi:hypothetical protein